MKGPVFGVIYDKYGSRYLLSVGAALHVGGLVAASFAEKQFYLLILFQGVCEFWCLFTDYDMISRTFTDNDNTHAVSAIGASMMLYPAIGAVSTWFSKRRALALGITSTGKHTNQKSDPCYLSLTT